VRPRLPQSRITEVHLASDSDFLEALTALAVSLVPGSLIVDADSGTRTLTIHVLDAHQQSDEQFVAQVLAQEDRIRRALGDDDPVPVAERPAMLAVRDEPDARRKIALFAAGLAQRQARSALVTILIRDGRHVDDSLAPVWAKVRDEGLAGMTALGRHLLETGQLRSGLGLAEVRDVLWNYLAIDHYERLVLSQGWPLERYGRWLAEAITSALCP